LKKKKQITNKLRRGNDDVSTLPFFRQVDWALVSAKLKLEEEMNLIREKKSGYLWSSLDAMSSAERD